MSRTVILSSETLASLLEAHASMAAWYYELWAAQREGRPPAPPDEHVRRAHLERVAAEFPEAAAAARAITSPRLYVPAPAAVAMPPRVDAILGAREPASEG
jgi:hypothetical protein